MTTVNVLTLINRQDRRDVLLPKLIKYKIPFKIWYGYEIAKQPFRAISKSHKSIVQFAKNTGMESITIMEDDCNLISAKAWKYYLDSVPKEFDLYFGTISGGEVDEEKKEVSGPWSGLILYTIHSRFYSAFLACDEDKNLDRYLSGIGIPDPERRLGRKPVYKICYPIVATCIDGISDNSKEMVVHDKYFCIYKKFGDAIK